MRRHTMMLLSLVMLGVGVHSWAEAGSEPVALTVRPVNAVVVTGGHDYDVKPFEGLFNSLNGIKVTYVALKDDSELFEDVSNWPYDVIVLYNLTQKISPKRQENLLKLLDQGVGLVTLHHAMGAYNDWPEFRKVIGCAFLMPSATDPAKPKSDYKHGVDIPVHVEDANHAITSGVSDFQVIDETYKSCVFEPDNHVLLTTTEPTSDKTIGWTRTYRKANTCTIQVGHGPQIFALDAYHRLIENAIRFCARPAADVKAGVEKPR